MTAPRTTHTPGGGRTITVKVDLYDDRDVGRACRAAAERLGLDEAAVRADVDALTAALEEHVAAERARLGAGGQAARPQPRMTAAAEAAARAALTADDPLAELGALLGRAGIVGEEASRLLVYVAASTYKTAHTLHVLIQGSSGSGKTRLLDVVARSLPAEDVKRFTRVTDSAFYNQSEDYFRHRVVCLEDLDGLKEEALLAFRELQSGEVLVSVVSAKDERGGITGGERVVRGPIASVACTTRGEVYEDNVSRCLVVAVDESAEQTQRIIAYQDARAAGKISRKEEAAARALLADCVRLVEPEEVVNPYAGRISLPAGAHKVRRLNELYLCFVRQVCLLNQYKRKRDGEGRVIAEVADLRWASRLLFEAIVLKTDELGGGLRGFYEGLKGYIASTGPRDREVDRHEVRAALGVSKTQQHRYLRTLVELEYLRQSGHANRGYRYRVARWDDAAGARERLRAELEAQLDALEGAGGTGAKGQKARR